MRTRLVSLAAITALVSSALLAAPPPPSSAHLAEKSAAAATIDRNTDRLTTLSDEVWRYAETALRETRSSKALADWAEAEGFRVTRNVADMPTAFVAEYGAGRPVIGILGEFDALPGLSQKAQPTKEELTPGAPGHGCGHNLLGVGSLGAAYAVKELIAQGKLKGTVKYFGTPAEEAVGGKVYMLRAGAMNGVDAMLAWHPSDETEADMKGTQAILDLIVEFHGRSAHAAFDPWNGRSAADGAEVFTFAVNRMREHIRPTSRIHYTVLEAGKVPNVIADYAKVWIWLRDPNRAEVDAMLARVRQIAEGAALAANVSSTVTVKAGDWNMLVNVAGERLMYGNLLWLGTLSFSDEEGQFAKTIQKEVGIEQKGLLTKPKPFEENPGPPEGGSTDVADVSWSVPVINVSVTTAPAAAPWHGWSVVACSGMSIGHKGMLYASKALAATMVDLFADPAALGAVRDEFSEKTKGITYTAYIPDGPPVPPPSK